MLKVNFLPGLVCALACLSCTLHERISGADPDPGTGRTAGRLVFDGGEGADGAEVTLFDSQGSFRLQTHADQDGNYRFDSLKFGSYNLSAVFLAGGRDPLVASHMGITLTQGNPRAELGTVTLLPPGVILARVLFRQNPVSPAVCHIPGTGFLAFTDDKGRCVLSGVPAGTYSVSFTAAGYIPVSTRPTQVTTRDTARVGNVELTVDPSQAPPRPTGLKMNYDTTSGIMRLSWSPVTGANLAGYVLYRDDTGATSFNPLAPLLTDTAYADTLFGLFQDGSPLHFAYRLRAQDRNGDQSLFARYKNAKATLPNLPFFPTPADGASDVELSPALSWRAVNGPGAVTYDVFLDTDPQADVPLAQGISANTVTAANLAGNTVYYWRVQAKVDGKARPSRVWQFTTRPPSNPNLPPLLPNPGDKKVTVGQSLVFNLFGSDPDGNNLEYAMPTGPAGATLAGNQFSWTPVSGQVGSHPVTFTVTDNGSPPLADTVRITVTVTPFADRPVVSVPSPTSSLRPTWTWVGGVGNGTFRFKLDDPNLSAGATITAALSFTPSADLGLGQHTLYVQEGDGAGNWSPSGQATVAIASGVSLNVDLIANFNRPGTSGGAATGLSGYTGADGREYALYNIQSPGALSVVEIFDGQQPVVPPKERGYIPAGHNSIWHEVRACGRYAYKISQEGNQGIQVIDLAPLDAGGNAVLVKSIANYFTVAHTLHCDETVTPHRLYVAYGTTTGVMIFSLEDPLNPLRLSTLVGEAHSVFARGDRMYVSTGRSGRVDIWDVSNPGNPVRRSAISLGFGTYSHQSWPSEDGRYLFTDEETTGKPLRIFDVSNMDAPVKVGEFRAPETGSLIIHNVYVKGNHLFVSHYTAGMRVWDISNPATPQEVAYRRVSTATGLYSGTADVFPFFRSGLAVYGDDEKGLFVVRPNLPKSTDAGVTPTGSHAQRQ